MRASPVQQVTSTADRSALMRYTGIATLARLGDAGGGIGILLLAVNRYGGGRGAVVGGLLTACITAPHVLGPWTGRLVDLVHDPRRILAAACALFAFALCGGSVLLHGGHPWCAAAAFAAAGTAGPLLTGGFSSLVGGFGGDIGRARGVDAVTYGIAGTAGPAVTAAVASAFSPVAGVLAVAAAVAVAALATVGLPASPLESRQTGPIRPGSKPSRHRGVLLRTPQLRQVTITTIAVAAGGGALGVTAVLLAAELDGGATTRSGWLVAALGAGNLVGALMVTVRPLRGEPVRQSVVLALSLAGATAAVGLAPNFIGALFAYALVGCLTGPWVTATLNARQRYAPSGRTGSVFVAMAGVKVAGASAGTAIAGVCSGLGARPLAVAAGVIILISTAAAATDLRRSR